MNQALIKLIDDFKKNKALFSLDEAATKQGIILKVLNNLGWDPFNIDEVSPEYTVENKRVDYALRIDNQNKVFIEVKKPDEDLEKHQQQLLLYAFHQGVKLAILTNGQEWWFYMPLMSGDWKDRKFYSINILEQDSEQIAEKFEAFLSKDNILSDKAVENAKKAYENKLKEKKYFEYLPKAWEKIICDQDEDLINLLANATEKLCGYRPTDEIVKNFLNNRLRNLLTDSTPPQPTDDIEISTIPISSQKDFTGKEIKAFHFLGIRYEVSSWREMLIMLCEILYKKNQNSFSNVLRLRGRQNFYFSKKPRDLRIPAQISNSDIYVEVHLSANSIVRLARVLMKMFGYQDSDLTIDVGRKNVN